MVAPSVMARWTVTGSPSSGSSGSGVVPGWLGCWDVEGVEVSG